VTRPEIGRVTLIPDQNLLISASAEYCARQSVRRDRFAYPGYVKTPMQTSAQADNRLPNARAIMSCGLLTEGCVGPVICSIFHRFNLAWRL